MPLLGALAGCGMRTPVDVASQHGSRVSCSPRLGVGQFTLLGGYRQRSSIQSRRVGKNLE